MELVESKASERRPQWRLRLPTPLLRGLELTPLCTQPTSQAHRFFGGIFFLMGGLQEFTLCVMRSFTAFCGGASNQRADAHLMRVPS